MLYEYAHQERNYPEPHPALRTCARMTTSGAVRKRRFYTVWSASTGPSSQRKRSEHEGYRRSRRDRAAANSLLERFIGQTEEERQDVLRAEAAMEAAPAPSVEPGRTLRVVA